jgi:flagellar hook-basal body complex protein FliE
MSNQIDTQNLMLQMRSLAAEAASKTVPVEKIDTTGVQSSESFSSLLSKSIDEVAKQQNKSSEMKSAFEKGEDADLTEVMIQAQKASLSFQAMTQVRNKLVEAYRDIKNMPI